MTVLKESTTSALLSILVGIAMSVSVAGAEANSRPNILLITADDMNYDSPGCMGSPLPGITPNLDRLAAEGILFTRCYNTSTICGPSRASLLSGLYPQSNGNMGHGRQPPGFWKDAHPGFEPPSVTTLLRDAGYFTALLDKSATRNCKWDYTRNHWQTHAGRDPRKFYEYTKEAIEEAGATGQPFFINANPTDPHRYWAGHPHETRQWIDEQMQGREISAYPNGKPYPDPDRTYSADAVPMPPCFPDAPELRSSIKHYYGSVKRLDMNVGAILEALNETGEAENTVVVFISDHGMGWAFAKWSLYPYGTRTPCVVRCPGRIPAGQVDNEHVLSTVDIAPTFLELAGVKPPPATDGFSFWSLATGADASWERQEAFSCFNFMNLLPEGREAAETWTPDLPGRLDQYRPMRSLAGRRYVYVWNAWANGRNTLPRQMGNGDELVQFLDDNGDGQGFRDRSEFYKTRVPEELYDTETDPGCRHNLVHEPAHAQTAAAFRRRMHGVLTTTRDAELPRFAEFIQGHL